MYKGNWDAPIGEELYCKREIGDCSDPCMCSSSKTNDRRQNIMKRDMKVEDESVKPHKILVGVIQLQVSISVTVIQGTDEINS